MQVLGLARDLPLTCPDYQQHDPPTSGLPGRSQDMLISDARGRVVSQSLLRSIPPAVTQGARSDCSMPGDMSHAMVHSERSCYIIASESF